MTFTVGVFSHEFYMYYQKILINAMVSNRLDQDQEGLFVGPGLGLDCLQFFYDICKVYYKHYDFYC